MFHDTLVVFRLFSYSPASVADGLKRVRTHTVCVCVCVCVCACLCRACVRVRLFVSVCVRGHYPYDNSTRKSVKNGERVKPLPDSLLLFADQLVSHLKELHINEVRVCRAFILYATQCCEYAFVHAFVHVQSQFIMRLALVGCSVTALIRIYRT
jgi:hypothetical protein